MDTLIDQLGGNRVLAEKLQVTPNAVSNWRDRGIPWRLRPAIARMAVEGGIALPTDFWGEAA